ncbi:low density lipoprotein receptor adapter protein 1 isoform X5 [Pan paniscus]|uniref:low density lipoprotein receptor adapter protein 1 isoform X5 n=1 Tax=Pan paniscus TaxID=9597 RepID=UPI001560543F
MDALKSAGRALIRSPSLAKQSWGGGGRHRKLPENWTDTRETLLEGMLFSLKYLGMTLVEQPKGEELSAAAIKRIVATAKASGKKLQKVTLKVSPRGIILTDNLTNQLIENVSIYRISYCTADKMHDKVFAYIAQSQHNQSLECHAFLCTKRKMTQCRWLLPREVPGLQVAVASPVSSHRCDSWLCLLGGHTDLKIQLLMSPLFISSSPLTRAGPGQGQLALGGRGLRRCRGFLWDEGSGSKREVQAQLLQGRPGLWSENFTQT